jgi:hypothetical protein
MINVACVLRQGGKVGYDATWVEKLQNNVTKSLSLPHRFVALSDCDVPCDRIPLDIVGKGWWSKIQLFKPGSLTGPTLFFDLDTIIFNDLNPLVETLLTQDRFVMWRDDQYNISSSAIMYWNGDYSHIYNTYMEKPEYWEDKFSKENQTETRQVGDQALICSTVSHIFINDLCPPDWIRVVSKRDDRVDFSNTRILIFKKEHSKPSTLPEHKIVKEYWK